MVNAFALTYFSNNDIFFLLQFRRNQKSDMPAYGFLLGISKYFSSTEIPACDNSLKVFTNDGIIRRVYNGCQAPDGNIRLGQHRIRYGNNLNTAFCFRGMAVLYGYTCKIKV